MANPNRICPPQASKQLKTMKKNKKNTNRASWLASGSYNQESRLALYNAIKGNGDSGRYVKWDKAVNILWVFEGPSEDSPVRYTGKCQRTWPVQNLVKGGWIKNITTPGTSCTKGVYVVGYDKEVCDAVANPLTSGPKCHSMDMFGRDDVE